MCGSHEFTRPSQQKLGTELLSSGLDPVTYARDSEGVWKCLIRISSDRKRKEDEMQEVLNLGCWNSTGRKQSSGWNNLAENLTEFPRQAKQSLSWALGLAGAGPEAQPLQAWRQKQGEPWPQSGVAIGPHRTMDLHSNRLWSAETDVCWGLVIPLFLLTSSMGNEQLFLACAVGAFGGKSLLRCLPKERSYAESQPHLIQMIGTWDFWKEQMCLWFWTQS